MAKSPNMGDPSVELARREHAERFFRVRAALRAEAERAAAERLALAQQVKERLASDGS